MVQARIHRFLKHFLTIVIHHSQGVKMSRLGRMIGVLFVLGAGHIAASAQEIELVLIGDPGNQADISRADGWRRVGAVNNVFRIGKYELTREQYLPFLNAVDPNGSNALKLYSALDFII